MKPEKKGWIAAGVGFAVFLVILYVSARVISAGLQDGK